MALTYQEVTEASVMEHLVEVAYRSNGLTLVDLTHEFRSDERDIVLDVRVGGLRSEWHLDKGGSARLEHVPVSPIPNSWP